MILSIQDNIEDFRDYISEKKKHLLLHKSKVERMLREEELLDNIFIDELSKEMDKEENKKDDKL